MRFSVIWVLILMQLTNATSNKGFHHIPNSCVDLFTNGHSSNGYYQIAGADGETWIVYCDFNSELGSVWTLVMSWSFANAKMPAFRRRSLREDAPVNALSPNWEVYRMSRDQMKFLKARSTHWRVTCQFDLVDVDYRDYVRGNFEHFDITSFQGGEECKDVEYINVRGFGGHTTVAFWQNEGAHLLHTDTQQGRCEFDASPGAKNNEDNFGYYSNTNNAFRCTSSPSATTQYWFGSYM